MANFTITSFTTTAQTLTGFENGLITGTGTLAASLAAVTVTNSGTEFSKLTVLGTLMSNGNSLGAKAVDFVGTSFNMVIGTGAHVLAPGASSNAISFNATDKVNLINHGSIIAGGDAIKSGSSDSFSTLKLINVGDISGSTGISFVDQTGAAGIQNSGTITGYRYGIFNETGTANTHRTNLSNTGTIQGVEFSYRGSDGDDLIDNSGFMIGKITLNDGNDRYIGKFGDIAGNVFGDDGDDRLVGGVASDTFFGGNDNDLLVGNGGDDDLDGGAGDDVLRGGEGNDTLTGGAGVDVLRGQQGDDVLDGGSEDDVLKGSAGEDTLIGRDGKDELFGGAGDDDLSGGNQKDDLHGGSGDDILSGGTGHDTLNGGRDDDTLTGGFGSDVFVFSRNAGHDRITDFVNGTDKIDLTAFGIKPSHYLAVVTLALSNAGGGDTVLDLTAIGGQGSILIEGLAFGDADSGDFIL